MAENQRGLFSLLVLFCVCKSTFAVQNVTEAVGMKREQSRGDIIFQDHLLWSIRTPSLLGCSKECAKDEECVSFTYWKNASEQWLTCRAHNVDAVQLSFSEEASGAGLFSVAGRTGE
ncbi:hypothetical protein BaRGS_00011421 [Batillaria attramentaria]|uniref:Apple domain-containing protein n=1 Tax=Batillaria attramentaria TaxID=370345 RepID=A0ABD0LD42_9CAEN